jgi:uncharacterized protein YjbI with pentapeptide repeats
MNHREVNWWKRNRVRLTVISSVIFSTFIVVIILGYRYSWSWTGFTSSTGPDIQQYQPTKTLWDWLQLFIVPTVLVITAFFFSLASNHNQAEVEKERNDTERSLAQQNQQEDLLQGYLDSMSELLLNKNLRTSELNTEVRNIARARTLTVLSRLDGGRKGILIKFLHESGLISTGRTGSIIDLSQADLCDANFIRANLVGAQLSKADLSRANLTEARLSAADLVSADLTRAILIGADLSEANLTNAILIEAFLNSAHLIEAKLHRAKLTDANLSNADLTSAKLTDADLRNADLSAATMRRAIFLGANLTGTKRDQVDDEGAIYSEEQKEIFQDSSLS